MLNVMVTIAILVQTLLPASFCPGNPAQCAKDTNKVTRCAPTSPCAKSGCAKTGRCHPKAKTAKPVSKPEVVAKKQCSKRCSKKEATAPVDRNVTTVQPAESQTAQPQVAPPQPTQPLTAGKSCDCRCAKKTPIPKHPATPPEAPTPSRVNDEKSEAASITAWTLGLDTSAVAHTIFYAGHDPPAELTHNHRQAELAVWLY